MIETIDSQSRVKERKIARILFICIGIAVAVGIFISTLAGRDKSLSPYKAENPQQQSAPDQKPTE